MAKQATTQVDELELAKQEEQRLEAELETERKRIEDEFRGKQAEARKKVLKLQEERAKDAHAQIVALVREFRPHLKLGQRNEIIRILESDVEGGTAAKKTSKAAGQKRPIKYEVPGQTWAGSGKVPTKFLEWEKTDEAKKWRAENPGEKWPPYKGG